MPQFEHPEALCSVDGPLKKWIILSSCCKFNLKENKEQKMCIWLIFDKYKKTVSDIIFYTPNKADLGGWIKKIPEKTKKVLGSTGLNYSGTGQMNINNVLTIPW